MLDPFSILWVVQYCNQITYPNESQCTEIYHNIRCVHRLRGSQGVSTTSPAKEHILPPENRSETR
ncbi:hypothetical protein OY07_24015 [Salmonella enterica subsp. enterica serovar Agona]|nr:hypothetical protein [Salmonella enterica]EAW8711694.1 hypothetical protein [Salmonella enterica]EBX8531832.1 hypothetical protein [Salmonella enterica subsp. enterica serovar Agona]ECH8656049.1 hypothetical protein [Salmonella enterica subsp. enterica serovar Agona]